MLVKELVVDKNLMLEQNAFDDDDADFCNPVYCLPDAYGLCAPDMDEDGGCDPHYDNG